MRSIISKEEAREKLSQGIQKLAEAVGVTLGPYGRTVAVWKGFGVPMVTKDGVSVAKEVILSDFHEATGAELVKAAAKKTAEEAGDGTTTATLLASALVDFGIQAFRGKLNIRDIRTEFEDGLKETVAFLDTIKKTVETPDNLVHVTSISANDRALGVTIGDHLWNVGKEGLASVEIGAEPGIKVKETTGYRFDKGWIAPQFVADPSRLRTLLDKCAIYMTPRTLTAGVELLPVFEAVVKDKNTKCLLMIVGGMEAEALATAIYNRQKDMIDVVVVKSPGFGERREEILGDIAAYTGGAMHGEEEQFNPSMLGMATKVDVDRLGTTIFGGQTTAKALEERKESIEMLKGETKSEYDRTELEKRLQALHGKAVTFEVGGRNETEALELYHRVEDAVLAAKAAMRGGVLPGAGRALLAAHTNLVARYPHFGMALLEPAMQLLKNAAIPIEELYPYLELEDPWMGREFDNWQSEPVSLYEKGIMDPYEVTVSALSNAVASALLVLGTDVVIIEEPEKQV